MYPIPKFSIPESASGNYENTYWNGKGKYQTISETLEKLIPDKGEVPNACGTPALELFRRASNCYYDLYNNGLCNRAEEFQEVFGFTGKEYREPLTQELIDATEQRMNQIVLEAANEQYSRALESIASLWPDPGSCGPLVPKYVGPNDGRMRADTLWFALNTARKALGKPEYPRPEHWDK